MLPSRREGGNGVLPLSQKNKLSPAWGPGRVKKCRRHALGLTSPSRAAGEEGTCNLEPSLRPGGPRRSGNSAQAECRIFGGPGSAARGAESDGGSRPPGQGEGDEDRRDRDEEPAAQGEERRPRTATAAAVSPAASALRPSRTRYSNAASESRTTTSGREASRGAAARSAVRSDCACTTIAGESRLDRLPSGEVHRHRDAVRVGLRLADQHDAVAEELLQ